MRALIATVILYLLIEATPLLAAIVVTPVNVDVDSYTACSDGTHSVCPGNVCINNGGSGGCGAEWGGYTCCDDRTGGVSSATRCSGSYYCGFPRYCERDYTFSAGECLPNVPTSETTEAPITGTPVCVYDFPNGASCNIRVVCTSDSTAKLMGTVLSPSTYQGHFANLPAGFAPITRQYYPGAVTGTSFSARLVVASESWILTDSGSGNGANKLWTISSGDWTLAPTSTVCMRCGAGEIPTSSEGTRSCAKCQKGAYSQAGATVCTLCAAGKYSTTTGASSDEACTACGVGTYSTVEGANSDNVCVSCAEGFTTATIASAILASCNVCAVGYYSSTGYGDGNGNSGCIQCDIHSTSC